MKSGDFGFASMKSYKVKHQKAIEKQNSSDLLRLSFLNDLGSVRPAIQRENKKHIWQVAPSGERNRPKGSNEAS